MAGTHNDINVLQRFSMFARLAEGHAPAVKFEITGNPYNKGYYLADGIHPPLSTFVKIIPDHSTDKKSHFVKCQEAFRKDVKWAFCVLQHRFAIVGYPASVGVSNVRVHCCVIMYNMIIESERDDQLFDHEGPIAQHAQVSTSGIPRHAT
jgi:hypothetical protein